MHDTTQLLSLGVDLPSVIGGWGCLLDAGFKGAPPVRFWMPASKAELAANPALIESNNTIKRFRAVEENLHAQVKQKWTILNRVDGIQRAKWELYVIVVSPFFLFCTAAAAQCAAPSTLAAHLPLSAFVPIANSALRSPTALCAWAARRRCGALPACGGPP
jgi:hypothetical protein